MGAAADAGLRADLGAARRGSGGGHPRLVIGACGCGSAARTRPWRRAPTPGSIRYRLTGVLHARDALDELNWDVTGNEWAFPIERARFVLRLPGPVAEEALPVEAWTGDGGASGADFTGVSRGRGARGGPLHAALRAGRGAHRAGCAGRPGWWRDWASARRSIPACAHRQPGRAAPRRCAAARPARAPARLVEGGGVTPSGASFRPGRSRPRSCRRAPCATSPRWGSTSPASPPPCWGSPRRGSCASRRAPETSGSCAWSGRRGARWDGTSGRCCGNSSPGQLGGGLAGGAGGAAGRAGGARGRFRSSPTRAGISARTASTWFPAPWWPWRRTWPRSSSAGAVASRPWGSSSRVALGLDRGVGFFAPLGVVRVEGGGGRPVERVS